ncbi:hypothetical protein MAQ5080_02963 [Marinomonas aquimarina]|uniref:Polysaccharide biosynthesis protein with aminopeptidase-like domain protein n=1 Tax=Marinomonas aquimarina TaxID=295068 RepID=A0A1A8TM40_9GAMM|nr:DUF4910 domain-containing protein [Marinomonas aquimarina]SBS34749.1 hypothetical protein MAQ5080_02963 [Marinomonas aquimarina]
MTALNLDRIFDQLFPICRSITGPGITQSLHILKEYMPLEIKEVATGSQVFDWQVPQEWALEHAALYDMNGNAIFSSEDSNLHVLNFSEPFSGVVSRQELFAHLHSIPNLPNAIPYVTSYYKPRWGLCVSEELKQTLTDESYRVEIKTKKYDGALRYGEYFLPGESQKTVLISTYLCHPSMGNNELSGPLAMLGLYEKLAQQTSRHYSYRFVVVPETIGSISYLATTEKQNLEHIVGGIVLTCLGGPHDKVSFKLSRRDWLDDSSSIDQLARLFAKADAEHYEVREFTPTSGSDERQYCSPSVNLPVIQAARTAYGKFPEYHTSLDNKAFTTIAAIEDSIDKLSLFIDCFELSHMTLQSTVAGGEPMLGKHDLYPTMNGPMTNKLSSDNALDSRAQLNLLLQLLSLFDGSRTLVEAVEKLDCSVMNAMPIVQQLLLKGILEKTS